MEFLKSDKSCDEFMREYEKSHCGEIVERQLSGTFKYHILDTDISCLGLYEENYDPNIWEMVNCLALSKEYEYTSKMETIQKYKDILTDALKVVNECQSRNSVSTVGLSR